MVKSFTEASADFCSELPYRKSPFSKRNWGHPWHSLCSYHGKLKPAIAYFLVKEFTKPRDVVLDPLCGVGTIPLEACLQGRTGIGNDLNPVGYVVTLAKTRRPNVEEIEATLQNLAHFLSVQTPSGEDPYADFGYNGKVSDYFHSQTYREILAARQFFSLHPVGNPSEALVLASLLHVLHGNRPYALSRNSHPLTPYAPTGPSVYKPVMGHLRAKINSSLSSSWDGMSPGHAHRGDFRLLPTKLGEGSVDAIITSPPFAGSLRFYIHNWMRLWFAGWEPEDFHGAEATFLEAQQKKTLDVYYDFFSTCSALLKDSGRLILHLGRSAKCDMASELSYRARQWFRVVNIKDESVDDLEKHGIRDKGGITAHQFVFMEKL